MKCLTAKQLKDFLESVDDETLVLISTKNGIGEQAHEIYTGIKFGNKKAFLIYHDEKQRSDVFE